VTKVSEAISEIINRRKKALPRKNTSSHKSRKTPANHQQNSFLNNDLSSKLNKIIFNKTLVETGQVKLLGLENLQERLGDKWPALLENIHNTLDAIVKKRISDNDVFFNKSENEFIIVFANTSHKAAQLICAKILQELTEKFAGPTDTKDIVIKTVAQQVDGEIYFQCEDLKSILGHVGKDEEKVPKTEDNPGLNSPSRAFDEENYVFGFRPVWDSRSEVITTFHVKACSDIDDNPAASHIPLKTGYDVLANKSSKEAIMGLDWMTLMCSISTLEDLFLNNFRAVFNIPLCYETVFTTELLLAYAARCEIIPDKLRKYIVFSLVDFPDGIPAVKLHFIVSTLKKYSRAVLVESESIDLHFEKYHDSGIRAISINISNHGTTPKKAWKQVIPFVNNCHKFKIQVSLLDVNTLEDLFIANENKVDFIAGDAIGKYKDYAGHMQRAPWTELISKL